MSDQSAPAEGQPTTDAPEQSGSESPPEWLGPINERMQELSESTGLMAEQIAALGQQPYYEDEDDGYEEYEDDGDNEGREALEFFDRRMDERLQTVLSKRDAAQAIEDREEAFQALREEIPQLQDDKLAARLVREAADYLTQNGQGHLIESPVFVDLIEDRYKRELYEAHASRERETSDEREVVLESAGGASQPAATKDNVDWGERIVKAAERLRPGI